MMSDSVFCLIGFPIRQKSPPGRILSYNFNGRGAVYHSSCRIVIAIKVLPALPRRRHRFSQRKVPW